MKPDRLLLALWLFILAWLLSLCAGCFAPTQAIVREFDVATGVLVREVVSSESVVKNITDATRDKTVVAFDDGWAAYISLTAATLENPTPTGRIFAGRTNHAYLSIHPAQQNLEGVAALIRAIRAGSLSVGAGGIEDTAE